MQECILRIKQLFSLICKINLFFDINIISYNLKNIIKVNIQKRHIIFKVNCKLTNILKLAKMKKNISSIFIQINICRGLICSKQFMIQVPFLMLINTLIIKKKILNKIMYKIMIIITNHNKKIKVIW